MVARNTVSRLMFAIIILYTSRPAAFKSRDVARPAKGSAKPSAFVGTYLLELPTTEPLDRFVHSSSTGSAVLDQLIGREYL